MKKNKPTTRLNKLRRLNTSLRKVDQAVYDAYRMLPELEKIAVFIDDEMKRARGRRN